MLIGFSAVEVGIERFNRPKEATHFSHTICFFQIITLFHQAVFVVSHIASSVLFEVLHTVYVVDKETYMVGSYGPKKEMQSYTTATEEAPSGMMGRGSYTMKSLFTDDDKHEHLKWEWKIEIKKDWD